MTNELARETADVTNEQLRQYIKMVIITLAKSKEIREAEKALMLCLTKDEQAEMTAFLADLHSNEGEK
jgi:hypothetical protein